MADEPAPSTTPSPSQEARAPTPPAAPAPVPPESPFALAESDLTDADAGAPPPDAGSSPPPAPERPRNQDGTFRKSEPLVAAARQLGLSQDDIDAYPAAELRDLVRDAVLERQARAHALGQPAAQPPPADSLGLDESQYDPGLMGVVKSLKAEILQLKAHQQRQQASTIEEHVDGAFAALGEPYERLFGKGPAADMKQDAVEMRRRKLVFDEAAKAATPGTKKHAQKVQELARELFAPAEPKSADGAGAYGGPRETLSDDKKAWLAGGLSRPTQRAALPEAAGTARAVKAVEQFRKEHGFNGTPESTDDFLPGG